MTENMTFGVVIRNGNRKVNNDALASSRRKLSLVGYKRNFTDSGNCLRLINFFH